MNVITTAPIIPKAITINFIVDELMKNIQETEIITDIKVIEYNFNIGDIPLFLLYSIIYGPTNLFDISLLYNLSELLIYKPAVSKRKGVVGRPGTTIPTIPIERESVPKIINTGLYKRIK